jgi:hypothetical protein
MTDLTKSEIKKIVKEGNIPDKDIRKSIHQSTKVLASLEASLEDAYDRSWIKLAHDIDLVQKYKLHVLWGYKNFTDYIKCKEEVCISDRKIYYLKNCYRRYFLGDIKIERELLEEVGWTKAAKIAECSLVQDEELRTYLKKAMKMTVGELVELLYSLGGNSKDVDFKSFHVAIPNKTLLSLGTLKHIFVENRYKDSKVKNSVFFSDIISIFAKISRNKIVTPIIKREIKRI